MNEYYKSPEWQRRRLKAMEYADFRCQLCNAKDKQLHVRHRTYDSFKNEPSNDLTVLCDNCHSMFHGTNRSLTNIGVRNRRIGPWWIYAVGPIDNNWDALRTIEETADFVKGDKWLEPRFQELWQSVYLAKEEGWEGDFRSRDNECRVFWLPDPNYAAFDFGFVFKQDNNGTCFVLSPQPLPALIQ